MVKKTVSNVKKVLAITQDTMKGHKVRVRSINALAKRLGRTPELISSKDASDRRLKSLLKKEEAESAKNQKAWSQIHAWGFKSGKSVLKWLLDNKS